MLYYYEIRKRPRFKVSRWFAALCALLVAWAYIYLGPTEFISSLLIKYAPTYVPTRHSALPRRPVERRRAVRHAGNYGIDLAQAEAVEQELADTGKRQEAEELKYSLGFLKQLGDSPTALTRARVIKRDIANTVEYFKSGNTASNKVQILGNYDGGNLAFVYYPHYGVHFNPVTTGNAAINQYGSGNYDAVVKTADELLRYVIVDQYPGVGSYYVWEYYFDFEFHGSRYPAPWASGMAQGLILDVLGKAYKITGEQKYLDAGKMVLNSFKVPWVEGGVVETDRNGNWYLEVASTNKLRILNGFLFTLNSLNNYYQDTGDEEARSLFVSGINEAKAHLHEYDTGYWSKYSLLNGDLANYTYHKLHVEILNKLTSITQDLELAMYARRFDFYLKNRFIDIPPTHRSFKAISSLTEQSIISDQNGWFSANLAITKGEFVRWLCRALGWSPETVYRGYYADIRRDVEDWGYIETAYENGVRLGRNDGFFRPNDGISQAEMESIIQLALSSGAYASSQSEVGLPGTAQARGTNKPALLKVNPIAVDSSRQMQDMVTREQAANRLYELIHAQ